MSSKLETETSGPTFVELKQIIVNTRQIDVNRANAPIIAEELNIDWAVSAKALITLKQQLGDKFDQSHVAQAGLAEFHNKAYGQVFKVTKTRLQFEASQEWLDKFYAGTDYLVQDRLHRNSYLTPVGCLGWVMLTTVRDDIVTIDTFYNRGIRPPVVVFIRRALFEMLRVELRSRNRFVGLTKPTGKMHFSLNKSNLTNGVISFITEDLKRVIKQRLESNYEKCFGQPLPTGFQFDVKETTSSPRQYLWEFYLRFSADEPMIKVGQIRLDDKVFYLEIEYHG